MSDELALKDSAVAMYLAWRFAQDERRLHDWIVRLGRANAEERLASLLLELRNRLSLLGMTRSERSYALPLTLQQIADHIGVTRVHVSRMLQRFRDSKLLTIERNQGICSTHWLRASNAKGGANSIEWIKALARGSANDRTNAGKEFGAPVGTEAACDFAVGGGGTQFPF